MTPRDAGRVFALAVSLVVLGQGQPAGAGVALREIDTRSYPTIRVTVVSSTGPRTVPALTEDGKAVTGIGAENLGRAKSVVLVVDRSQSMAGASLTAAAAGARAFVARKPRVDRIAVVALAAKATQLSDFSTATIDADTALRSLSVAGRAGTALYDAVVLASAALGGQPARGRVLILLTDGRDVSSRATLSQAIEAARSAGAVVYPIGIESRDFSRAPLERLARATGGRYYGTASPSALAAIYASVAADLARTWLLSYATAARPGDSVMLRASIAGEGSSEQRLAIPDGVLDSSRPPRPARLFGPALYGRWGQRGVALAVGLLVLLAASLALGALRRSRLRARLAAQLGESQGAPRRETPRRGFRGIAPTALLRATERVFGRRRQWSRLQRRLEQGDVPLRAAEFVYLVLGSGLLLGLLAFAAGVAAPLVLGAILLGVGAPFVAVSLRIRRRLRAFEAQLPDLLVTMAAALKAGHSFKQGIQAAADEDQAPASDEFRRVLTETGLGRPIEDALNDMARRLGSRNFEFVITAVTIQRQVGGSLSGLFDLVADTVRQRQQAARNIRGLTAMGRMSAYTLLGLPLFGAGAITLLNPGYMSPLYSTGAGHLLLGVAVVMMGVGALVLKAIVSFKG